MSHSLRSLAGRSLFRLSQRGLRLAAGVKASMPRVFGLPVRGALVQLYRDDAEVTTHLSFANYLSLFAPKSRVRISLGLRAWDRGGGLIGRATRDIGHGGTLQAPLAELIGTKLDDHGIFAIDARYDPPFDPEARFLGETTPQFMTLFVPAAGRGSPQMLHSHKELDRFPISYSPNSRRSSMIAPLAGLERLELFVLNSSPGRVRSRIVVHDCADDRQCLERAVEIPGRGVERIAIAPAEMAPRPEVASLQLEFDRLTSHRKPILFRTYANGTIVSNHT